MATENVPLVATENVPLHARLGWQWPACGSPTDSGVVRRERSDRRPTPDARRGLRVGAGDLGLLTERLGRGSGREVGDTLSVADDRDRRRPVA